MALGQEQDITLRRILDVYDAVTLLESEDLKDRKGENKERELNIVTRLDFKVIHKLTRLKDQAEPINRTIKKNQRTIQQKHTTERDDKGVGVKLNVLTFNEEWESYLDQTEKLSIPKFALSDFVREKKFIVPMKFLSLMGELIEDDCKD